MHTHDLKSWIPTHAFHDSNPNAERGIRVVVLITAVMMVVEIVAGWWFNSMALLADGWHMSSHTLAIGISALAYSAARRLKHDTRFSFGTWKIEVLGGFASSLFLFGIAGYMVIESVMRLMEPQTIRFNEAIIVAIVGLLVNVVCALILGGAHTHGHADGHDHGHSHGHDDHHDHAPHEHEHAEAHRDLNLKSAHVHVITDALTSVLAIVALLGGKFFGWNWLDPVMGVVGAILIIVWAVGLLRETGRVLLDCEMDRPIVGKVQEAIATLPPASATRIADLHVWRVGRQRYALILSVVTDDPTLTPLRVKHVLSNLKELAHITAEVNMCPEHCRTS